MDDIKTSPEGRVTISIEDNWLSGSLTIVVDNP